MERIIDMINELISKYLPPSRWEVKIEGQGIVEWRLQTIRYPGGEYKIILAFPNLINFSWNGYPSTTYLLTGKDEDLDKLDEDINKLEDSLFDLIDDGVLERDFTISIYD